MIGNSQAVAREHYLQITDDHYKQARAIDGRCKIRRARCRKWVEMRRTKRVATPEKPPKNKGFQPIAT
jgi:hypothetical protein